MNYGAPLTASSAAIKRSNPCGLAASAGCQIMAESDSRVRFAVTVFYDRKRLADAFGSLRDLGLADGALWAAGPADLLEADTPLLQSLPMRKGSLHELLPPSGTNAQPDANAVGDGGEFLIGTFWGDGAECLKGLLHGEIGAILRGHAEQGAAIVAARTESAELQDQSLRELLRHSQHMVYSWECRSVPAKQTPTGG